MPIAPDQDVLLQVVEDVALLLTEAGLPRMPARVFAYVLAEDRDRYTARDLAEGLRVSPAAISGALRQLTLAGMLDRQREPGARSDHYRIYDDDVWSAILGQRLPLLQRWETVTSEAADRLAGTQGGRRLRETQAYFRFMATEMAALQDRWHAEREALTDALEAEARKDV